MGQAVLSVLSIKSAISEDSGNILKFSFSRVKNSWTGQAVLSVLSIKSAISEDSGNYSCGLPHSSILTEVPIIILKGDNFTVKL
jgi:hypothetical protein